MNRGRTLAIILSSVAAGVVGSVLAFRYYAPELVLKIDEDVSVALRGRIPFRAAVDQRVDVRLSKEIAADVSLGQLAIPLDVKLQVPLDFALQVPLDTEVALDDTFDLEARVAIDTVLTERELDLSKLAIPIDAEVYVDDTIAIETVIAVDTEVTTLLGVKVPVKANVPVKARVPIHQKVHIRDVIEVGVPKLRVPLHLVIPVRAQVPIKRSLRVRGMVSVPIKRRIEVPVKQLLHVDIADSIAAKVTIEGKLPADLKADLDGVVAIDHVIPAHLGTIAIQPSEVSIGRRNEQPHRPSSKPPSDHSH